MRNDGRIYRHVPWGNKGCIAKTEEVISLIYHTVAICCRRVHLIVFSPGMGIKVNNDTPF